MMVFKKTSLKTADNKAAFALILDGSVEKITIGSLRTDRF